MFFDEEDKLKQIERRLWVELYTAANGPSSAAMKLPTVATVHHGRPQLRTVILRKVEEKSLFFFSDSRTEKVQSLKANPSVALHFYDHERKLQVRVRGEAVLHQRNELSRSEFDKLSEKQKREYNASPSPGTAIKNPSTPYKSREPQDDKYFCVVEVKTEQLSLLQLHEDHHYSVRFLYDDGDYHGEWIRP